VALDALVISVHLEGVAVEGDLRRARFIVVSPTPDFQVEIDGLVRRDISAATHLVEQWPMWRESRSQPWMVRVWFSPPEGSLAWLTVAGVTVPVPLTDDWHTLPELENIRRISGPVATQETHLWGGVVSAWKVYQMTGDASPVLDWGVGAGRVAVPLRRLFGVEVLGVDVDEVNVRWCQENLPDVPVSLSTLYPPLDFPDNHFAAVYGISVMTHLQRDTQLVWLRELRRVLQPGGVAILTVHGDHSLIQRPMTDAVSRAIAEDGISDHERDDIVAVAEAGYYRGTFQLRAQVKEAWGAVMPIVAYLPTANALRQDYVVLRRDR
jgi:SAM-dependent methyltransferase